MIRRHLTPVILASLFVGLSVDVAPARAQWWLITKGSPQGELLEARERVRTLLAAEGTEVLEEQRIRREFESQISVPPTFLTQSQINEWVEQSRAALMSLANADYEDARRALLHAQELSQRAAEELNRETDRARAVLDTCLYMVRAFVETGDVEGAREQARSCRRLVPQIEPSRRRHTPEVRAVLENLDQERNASPAVLRVESTPSNCVVRLNGIQVGRTPFAMPGFARGEYRVQVECGEARGRVHHISLDDEVVHLTVDTVFDQEMHSRPVFVDDNARADAHAATLAGKVDATIVMVSPEGDGYRLTRFEADWRASSRVVPFERLEQAVRQIVSRESGDSGTQVDPSRPSGPPTTLPVWRVGVGTAMLAAGVGLSIAAAVVHVQRDSLGVDYVAAFPGDSTFLTRQRKWQDAGTITLALAITGGGLAAFSIPAWLPHRRGVHWASWAIGGLGLIGAGTALALTLLRETCPDVSSMENRQLCVDREQRGGAAAIIGGASMTLVAVPIVDALQRNPTGGEQVSLHLSPHAGRHGAGLTLRGSF